MSVLSDKTIKQLCIEAEKPLIWPFVEDSISVDRGVSIPSYGLTSYGYDVRLGRNIKYFMTEGPDHHYVTYKRGNMEQCAKIPTTARVMKTTGHQDPLYVEIKDIDSIVLPPGAFILAHTDEHFNIPRNVTGICVGKSTIARTGIIVTVTPLEPEWTGYLTLEITNPTSLPIELTTGIGITQIQFHTGDQDCEVSYGDRKGKYMNQAKEPVEAILS